MFKFLVKSRFINKVIFPIFFGLLFIMTKSAVIAEAEQVSNYYLFAVGASAYIFVSGVLEIIWALIMDIRGIISRRTKP